MKKTADEGPGPACPVVLVVEGCRPVVDFRQERRSYSKTLQWIWGDRGICAFLSKGWTGQVNLFYEFDRRGLTKLGTIGRVASFFRICCPLDVCEHQIRFEFSSTECLWEGAPDRPPKRRKRDENIEILFEMCMATRRTSDPAEVLDNSRRFLEFAEREGRMSVSHEVRVMVENVEKVIDSIAARDLRDQRRRLVGRCENLLK